MVNLEKIVVIKSKDWIRKKVIMPILFFMIGIIFLSTLTVQTALSQTQKSFSDLGGKFTVLYPSDWEISPRDSSFPYYGTATVISFRPISNSGDLTDNPSVSITPTDVAKVLDTKDLKVKPKTLEQIANDSITFYKDPNSPLGNTQFELLKSNSTTVGGMPALQIQYILKSLGLFTMQTYVIKDDKLYTISFSAPELRVPDTLPGAQMIIKSFKFT
jgi:PsbP